MSHTSDPPIFSSTCIHTCLCTGFVLVRGSVCSGVCLGYFCLEGFVRGGACPYPFCQNTFHYNRKLIITFNFRFHTYEIFLKCDVTCSWTPPPVTNCHTFSDPFPLERDVLYGRPPTGTTIISLLFHTLCFPLSQNSQLLPVLPH